MVTGSACPWSIGRWHHSQKSGHRQRKQIRAGAPKWPEAISCCENLIISWNKGHLHFRWTDWKRNVKWKEGWRESKQMTLADVFESSHTQLPFAFFSSCRNKSCDKCFCGSMRNYYIMLFSLHFKNTRKHIKFISLLWELRSRIYSIAFRLLNIYTSGLKILFSNFRSNPDVFNPCHLIINDK